MKTQNIRLFDVFVLGPFMMWAASQMKGDVAASIMFGAGAGTILYNGRNYMLQRNSDVSRAFVEQVTGTKLPTAP